MYYCCSFLLLYFYLIFILLFIVFIWHWNLHAEDKVNNLVVVYCLHIQSELACSRHSDSEDGAKSCEQKKPFSRSLSSRRTPLSKRLKQAKAQRTFVWEAIGCSCVSLKFAYTWNTQKKQAKRKNILTFSQAPNCSTGVD